MQKNYFTIRFWFRKSDLALIDQSFKSGVSFFNSVQNMIYGAAATAIFSYSLHKLFHAGAMDVLFNGIWIPSLTWIAQLTLSFVLLSGRKRLEYWDILCNLCLIGSLVLLIPGIYNLLLPKPHYLVSVVFTLLSASLMTVEMFRRSKLLNFPTIWPASFALMLALNILFYALFNGFTF